MKKLFPKYLNCFAFGFLMSGLLLKAILSAQPVPETDQEILPLSSASAPASGGLQVWLKADEGIVLSNDRILRWNNAGEIGSYVSASREGEHPRQLLNRVNGHATVYFNGMGNNLSMVSAAFSTLNESGEMFIVLKPGPDAPGRSAYRLFQTGSSQYPNASGKISERFGTVNGVTFDADTNGWHIHNVSVKPGEWVARLDGEEKTRTGNGTVQFWGVMELSSAALPWQGEVAEVIVYNRCLDEAERTRTHAYLEEKYRPDDAPRDWDLPVPKPDTPVIRNIVTTQGDQVKIDYNSVIGETGMEIERSTDGINWQSLGTFAALYGTYVDSGLLPATTYYYRMRTHMRAYVSDWSEVVTVTTEAVSSAVPSGGNILWLKAGEGINLQSGKVREWNDVSIDANHFYNYTAAEMPQWLDNRLNGHPSVYFNGLNEFLRNSSLSSQSTYREVFVVLKPKPGTYNASPYGFGYSANGVKYPISSGQVRDGTWLSSNVFFPADVNGWHIYNVSVDPGLWVARLDNQEKGRSLNHSLFPWNGGYLGKGVSDGKSWAGEIAELIAYERVLSDAERNQVYGYLNEKYHPRLAPAGWDLPAVKPLAPVLTIDGQSGDSIRLSWTSPSGLEGYEIQRRTENGDFVTIVSQESDMPLNFTDREMLPSTNYGYRMRLKINGDYSDWSAVQSIRTADAVNPVERDSLFLWLVGDDLGTGGQSNFWPGHGTKTGYGSFQSATIQANALNGHTVLDINTNNGKMYAPASFLGGQMEYFVVLKVDPVSAGKQTAGFGSKVRYPNAAGKIEDNLVRKDVITFSAPALDQWHLYNVTAGLGVWEARFNGTVIYADKNPQRNAMFSVMEYRLSTPWKGAIAEIICYKETLDANTRSLIEQYLMKKYRLGRQAEVTVPSAWGAAVSDGGVGLSWEPGNNGEGTQYVIERREQGGAWEVIASVSGTSYTDAAAVPGKAYEYRIKSVLDSESSPYADSLAVSLPLLKQLSVRTVGSSQVVLGWDGRASRDVSYVVERKQADGTYAAVATVVDRNGFVDTQVLPGSTHSYRVKTIRGVIHSSYTAELSVTVPLNGAVMPLDGLRIWLRPDSFDMGLNVWNDESGHYNDASQYFPENTPQLTEERIAGYLPVRFDVTRYQYFSLGSAMNGAEAGDVFVVLKTREANPSGSRGLWSFGNGYPNYPSGASGITEHFGSRSLYAAPVAKEKLSSWHLYAVSAKQGQWENRLNGGLLFRSPDHTVYFPQTQLLGSNQIHYFDGDIAEVIVYDRSLSDSERFAVGSCLTGKYGISIAVPAVPANLNARIIAGKNPVLTWQYSGIPGTVYVIERKKAGGSYAVIATVEDMSVYYDREALEDGAVYSYRIKAKNFGGESVYCGTVSVTVAEGSAVLPENGLRLWLSADSNAFGSVSVWQDRSGSNNHANRTSINQRPLAVADGANGFPAVRFSEETQSQLYFANDMMNGSNAGEFFAVLKAKSALPARDQWAWTCGYANTYYPKASGRIYESFGSNGTETGVPKSDISQWHLYHVSSAPYEWVSRLNGQEQYRMAYGTSGLSPVMLGSSFNGDFAEILLYNRQLSAGERKDVELYLASKYGLQTLLNAMEAPGSPASYAEAGKIFLSWLGGNNGSLTKYLIERREEGGDWVTIATVSGTDYIDATAVDGKTYAYRIKALWDVYASAWSQELSVSLPHADIATPGELEIQLYTTSTPFVFVSWNAVDEEQVSYVTERSLDGKTWTVVNRAYQPYYADANVSFGNTYWYRVYATAGERVSHTTERVSVKVVPVPGNPNAFSGSLGSNGSVSLHWSGNVQYGAKYTVERRKTGEDWQLIATVTSLNFTDTGLEPGVSYEYRVRGINESYASDYSATLTVTWNPSTAGDSLPTYGMRLWLRGDRGATRYHDGSYWRSGWQDQSGNGNSIVNDATSGVSLVTGAENYFYFMPYGNSLFTLPQGALNGMGHYELFVVSKPGGYNTGSVLGFFTNQGTMLDMGGLATHMPFGSTFDANWSIQGFVKGNYAVKALYNGKVIRQEKPEAVSFVWPDLVSVNKNGWNGSLAEVIVYARELSDFEREQVNAYLGAKYGIMTESFSVVPRNVKGFAVSGTQAHLSWEGTQKWDISYVIERSTTGGVYEPVAEVSGLSYVDTGLTRSSAYSYRVYAKAGGQLSAASQTVSVTTPDATQAKMPLGALCLWLKGDSGTITDEQLMTWRSQTGYFDAVASSSYYTGRILSDAAGIRYLSSNSSYPLQCLNAMHAGVTSGEVITVQKGSGAAIYIGGKAFPQIESKYLAENRFNIISTVFSPSVQQLWVNGVHRVDKNAATVFSSARAYLGTENLAEILFFDRPLSDAERNTVTLYLARKYAMTWVKPPEAPCGLRAFAINGSQVSLRWSKGEDTSLILRYAVERSSGSGEWEPVGETASYGIIDSEREAGVTYLYRVRAIGLSAASPYSAEVRVTPAGGTEGAIPLENLRLWLKGTDGGVTDDSPSSYRVSGSSAWDSDSFTAVMKEAWSPDSVNLLDGSNEGELFFISYYAQTLGYNFSQKQDSALNASSQYIYEGFGRDSTLILNSASRLSGRYPVYVYNVSAGRNEWTFRENGVTLKDETRLGVNSFASGRFRLDGACGEVMVFDRLLTEDERDSVQRYLCMLNEIAVIVPPSKPGNVKVDSVSGNKVTLSWEGDEAEYIIERNMNGEFVYYATVRNSHIFIDTVKENEGCTYRIISVNAYGQKSEYSDVIVKSAYAEDTGAVWNTRLWLRVDDTVKADASGTVWEWTNGVIGRRAMTQPLAPSRPKLVPADADCAHATVRFDGNTFLHFPMDLLKDAESPEIFMVVKDEDKTSPPDCYRFSFDNLMCRPHGNRVPVKGFQVYHAVMDKKMVEMDPMRVTEIFGKNFKGELAEMIIYAKSLGDEGTQQKLRELKEAYGITDSVETRSLYEYGLNAYILETDGSVWGRGMSNYGQLGPQSGVKQPYYTKLPGVSNAVAVAGGETYTLVLTDDERMLVLGTVTHGKGDEERYTRRYETAAQVWQHVSRIGSNIAYSNGQVLFWEGNNFESTFWLNLEGVRQVAGYGNYWVLLMENGSVRVWAKEGSCYIGLAGGTRSYFYQGDVRIEEVRTGLTGIRKIDVYKNHLAAVDANGKAYWWNLSTDYPEMVALQPHMRVTDVKLDDKGRIGYLLEDGRWVPGAYSAMVGDFTTDEAKAYSYAEDILSIGRNMALRKDGTMLNTDTTNSIFLNGFGAEYFSYREKDSDHDGMDDDWEMEHFGNLEQNGYDDPDGDGMKNVREFYDRTDPNNQDSNFDGKSDGDVGMSAPMQEVHLVPDYNRDGLLNTEDYSAGYTVNYEDKQYKSVWYFWVNNDNDAGGASGSDWMYGEFNDSHDLKINGEKDITDFFPVRIDLKNLFAFMAVRELPEEWDDLNIYFLNETGALNVMPVYFEGNAIPHKSVQATTGLLDRTLIQTRIIRERDIKPVMIIRKDAGTPYAVNEDGCMVIDRAYWQGLSTDGFKHCFGILAEAQRITEKPLVMEIWNKKGDFICRSELPLSIDLVTKMYRHANLCDRLVDEHGNPRTEIIPRYASRPGEPSNYPDSPCDADTFVFVHGFNVNQTIAEGWQSEIFKNLFWTGSKYKFYGITWFGSEGISANYQHNVVNAFETAPFVAALIRELKEQGGRVVVAGHSLGNMVLSAAIQDHGANPDTYLMLNPAVPKEAYDGSEEDLTDKTAKAKPDYVETPGYIGMEHPAWRQHERSLWSAEWYKHWKNIGWADERAKLTWRGRFKDINEKLRGHLYNYYSNGEDTLSPPTGDDPWVVMLSESWRAQEQLKGKLFDVWVSGTGGWAFNTAYSTVGRTAIWANEHFASDSALLREKPLFIPDDPRLHQVNREGSEFCLENKNRLLAGVIPATSFAAGSSPLKALSNYQENRNTNMNTSFQMTGKNDKKEDILLWPKERLERESISNRWLHSDIREVAYPYVYSFYEDILKK